MSGGIDSFADLVLASATDQGGSTEQVLGDTDFIIRGSVRTPRTVGRVHRRGRECLAWIRAWSSPQEFGTGSHCMNDELDAFSGHQAHPKQ